MLASAIRLKTLTDVEFDWLRVDRPCPWCDDERLLNGSTHDDPCPLHAEWLRRGGFAWPGPPENERGDVRKSAERADRVRALWRIVVGGTP